MDTSGLDVVIGEVKSGVRWSILESVQTRSGGIVHELW